MNKRLVVIVLAIGVIPAGCGGNGNSNSGGNSIATSDLNKQEWVAQANKICSNLDSATDKRAEQFFSGENATEIRFAREIVAPGLERWADKLQRLGAPKGQEEKVERTVAVAGLIADEFRGAESSADIRGAEGTQTRVLFDEGKQLAGQLGIEAPCGDGSR